MDNISKLINQLAAQQKLVSDTEFIAPCVKGGKVRTSVDGIIYTFNPVPSEFEGWGFFQPINYTEAELVQEASQDKISEYLNRLKPLRLRLIYPLRDQSWLAYPINESDMQQRFHLCKPVVVHLVSQGSPFEPIIARHDHSIWWFEEIDRRMEPQPTTILNNSFQQAISPSTLAFSGMTKEMLTAYEIAWAQTLPAQEENQLKKALDQGGGLLQNFRDCGDYWQIEWRSVNGELHSSAIAKNDLTVISSGICLSGRDRDFDLQSLVGVMEKRDDFLED